MSNQAGRSRVVGILGGMGPRATVDFYDKLVRYTPAGSDQEHLRVVIWADPTIPSRQAALLNGGTDPTPWLERGVRHLVRSGAEVIVVPCNTVHVFLPHVMTAQTVEFISIVDATTDAIECRGARRVGLLATEGALRSGLFQDALQERGIDWVLPNDDDQARLNALVDSVKSGETGGEECRHLIDLLTNLERQGVDLSVAGCTEVSALIAGLPTNVSANVLDPSLELALATIARARGQKSSAADHRPDGR